MFRPFRSVFSACAGALRQLTVCGSPLPSALRRLLDHALALAELWTHPVAKLVTDLLLDKGFRLTVIDAWYDAEPAGGGVVRDRPPAPGGAPRTGHRSGRR
ncbi:hypothetical protein AB0K74_30715 [Streptomyces sp. NPDC056159]|uniref:hypothetical protein n=1 Tax=Streptomyces sp. NPDC056159 TaxID=3155537 RepID=UPI00344299C1